MQRLKKCYIFIMKYFTVKRDTQTLGFICSDEKAQQKWNPCFHVYIIWTSALLSSSSGPSGPLFVSAGVCLLACCSSVLHVCPPTDQSAPGPCSGQPKVRKSHLTATPERFQENSRRGLD